ncbi:MAG: hypothetical protein IKU07_01025, partial [Oscillospiraceae bacterium]|nr:hypothetical protein [Oscillospiraceae bacterium]
MKRLFSFLLVLCMVLSMVPASVFAAEERTVYLDAKGGNNNNSGLTEDAPVKTLAQAYSLLSGASAGRIVFLSTTEFTANYNAPVHTIPVTLTSKTGAEGFRSEKNVYFRGPTTLENMTVTNYSENSYTLLCGGGHKFVIGDGVNSVAENGYYFCLTGGSNSATVSSVDLTVRSGHWRNIYIVSHAVNGIVTGDCTADISGCIVDTGIAMGYKGIAKGNANITITNTTVTNVYPCSTNTAGAVEGSVTITLGEGACVGNVYTDSSSMSYVKGGVTYYIDGAEIDTIKRSSQHASTGETVVNVKSGTVKTCKDAADAVNIDIPENKTLILTGETEADTLKSAGTLEFSGSATLTAKAVAGSVYCTVDGTVLPGHLYLDAPADADITFDKSTGIQNNNGQWTVGGEAGEDNFTGLVLVAKPDVTVTLYTGYVDGTKLTPDKIVEGEQNAYYYDIDKGAYRYIVSGTGYYKIEKIVYMTEAEAATKTVVDVTPPVKSGKGWEQTSVVQQYSDEVLNGVQKSEPSLWPTYSDVFTTPWFTVERTEHQMTTQDQMNAFIDSLDDENDHIYVYNAGYSSIYSFDISAIVLTKADLTGTKTLEEAAAKLDKTKPTILYRAHMHGSEPASGEAALAILQRLDGTLGDDVLDSVNIVMIPRHNPDGAYTYTRDVIGEVDPNGDLMKMRVGETDIYMRVFNLFAPEIVLDGHEYTTNIAQSNLSDGDAMIGFGFTLENSDAFREAYRPLDKQMQENLAANGLNYRYYTNIVNHNGASVSRSFTSLQGTMFMLIESRGIRSGTTGYARRIITQVITMQTAIEYVAENADTIKSLVAAERQRIIDLGSTYEESDQVLLELEATSDTSWKHTQSTSDQAGTVKTSTKTPTVWNKVVRSRIAPTAYVIPAGTSYVSQVLALLDKQEIKYTYIPVGATVQLQQYFMDGSTVTLGDEEAVTFGKGAYVFCKNQVKGNILSMYMEPDVTKSSGSSFVGMGILPNMGGRLPLYRYCHDLNTDGFVDYTFTEVAAASLTVYLDGTNGADTNDGLTPTTPVKTLEQAYALLNETISLAAAGSEGTVVVSGLYDFGAQQANLPAADFPVTIRGNTADDGFLFTGGDTQEKRTLEIHGDTTFENLTLKINNKETFNYMLGNGYKLVIGQNVNTIPYKTNAYFTLAGGDYGYTDSTASTDLTVLSGQWRSIYAGGYRASVTGAAKAVIENCYVYHSIAPTYCGNIGSSDITIRNTEVVAQSTSAIYCGPIVYNSSYAVGAIKGESKLTVGDNVTAAAVYAGSRERGNTEDLVTITIAANSVSMPIYSRPHAESEGKVNQVLLVLANDITGNLTLDTTTLDMAGFDITGNLTVDGTVTVFDSATDDYDVSDGKYGEITGAVNGTLVAKDGYIAAAGGFHKFGGQYISSVSLRPGNAGIYYTATFLADEVL